MKVGIIGSVNSVHESRFLRAFRERGIDSIFIGFDELEQGPRNNRLPDEFDEIDFLFGGPLHHGHHFAAMLEVLPFIAVSYAFDILYESARDINAASSVRQLLGLCCGLLVDCDAAARGAKDLFGYTGPTLVRAWGLENTKPMVLPVEKSEQAGEINDQSPLSIVSIRNFTELHGVMDVIRAFDRAARSDQRLRLILAGDGPLKGAICELIDSLRLSDRVTILGSIPETEVVGLIQQAAVYVSASVVDGTSISLLQALEAGVTVILSNVGGNPEWAGRTEGAILFERGNWQQLGDLMVSEAAFSGLRRFDRSDLLAQHADWKRNADDIVNFSLQLVEKPHKPNPSNTIISK